MIRIADKFWHSNTFVAIQLAHILLCIGYVIVVCLSHRLLLLIASNIHFSPLALQLKESVICFQFKVFFMFPFFHSPKLVVDFRLQHLLLVLDTPNIGRHIGLPFGLENVRS